jgi:nucleotide-binding universal stress UspA family protein
MHERILIPLDGSRVGEAALPYIKELVAKLSPSVKVEITLFQSVSSLTHYVIAGEASAPVPYTEPEMAQIKKKAEEYLAKVGQEFQAKNVVVRSEVGVGKAAEEINKAADEFDVDLITMSTHGRSGISRWAFGSVTEKILRSGNRPVLMVRAPTERA